MDEKTRALGQKAMLALAAALATKSVAIDPGSVQSALPIKLSDTSNLAVIVGLFGIFSTIYFVLRVLDETWAAKLAFDVESQLSKRASKKIDAKDGDYIDGSTRLKSATSFGLSIFEFWLPIALAVATAIAIYGDVPHFVYTVFLNKP